MLHDPAWLAGGGGPGDAPPRPLARRWRAEQAEEIFQPQAGRTTQRSGVVLALETKFLLFDVGQERDSVLSWSPALPSPHPASLASPCPPAVPPPTWDGTGRGVPGRPRPLSFQQAPPSKERGPSAPARSPPAKPQTPSDFAFRRRSVRSRCTRSAKTWRVTPRRTAMSPYCQPSTIRHSSSLRSSACRSRRRARS